MISDAVKVLEGWGLKVSIGKSPENLVSLHDALFGEWKSIEWGGRFLRPAHVSGEVTGGNLSLIYSLCGTPFDLKTKGKILFIEEVGEYLYHLDRMLLKTGPFI
jgi:muramoyltetrapeptide carboxypeptidase